MVCKKIHSLSHGEGESRRKAVRERGCLFGCCSTDHGTPILLCWLTQTDVFDQHTFISRYFLKNIKKKNGNGITFFLYLCNYKDPQLIKLQLKSLNLWTRNFYTYFLSYYIIADIPSWAISCYEIRHSRYNCDDYPLLTLLCFNEHNRS